jgi:hypothetical protein
MMCGMHFILYQNYLSAYVSTAAKGGGGLGGKYDRKRCARVTKRLPFASKPSTWTHAVNAHPTQEMFFEQI